MVLLQKLLTSPEPIPPYSHLISESICAVVSPGHVLFSKIPAKFFVWRLCQTSFLGTFVTTIIDPSYFHPDIIPLHHPLRMLLFPCAARQPIYSFILAITSLFLTLPLSHMRPSSLKLIYHFTRIIMISERRYDGLYEKLVHPVSFPESTSVRNPWESPHFH